MFKLSDLSEQKKRELLGLFIQHKEVREALGGCPADEERVLGYTNCFNCSDCWISAIEHSFESEKKSNDTYQKLVDILVEHFEINKNKIYLNSHLHDDLGADSLDIVEILMTVEDVFNISTKDIEYGNNYPKTVRALYDYIYRKIK